MSGKVRAYVHLSATIDLDTEELTVTDAWVDELDLYGGLGPSWVRPDTNDAVKPTDRQTEKWTEAINDAIRGQGIDV